MKLYTRVKKKKEPDIAGEIFKNTLSQRLGHLLETLNFTKIFFLNILFSNRKVKEHLFLKHS